MRYYTIRYILLMGVSLGLFWSQTALAVVYVDKDRPAGGNGASWAQAYNSLATAVNNNLSGQEFWIAEGTYTPFATITIRIGQNHAFYGGFAGNETARDQRDVSAHPVIIDGLGSLQHVFYVLYKVTNVRFDGLTIQGGTATGSPLTSDTAQGGAILANTVSSLVIANCTFKNNTSRGLGGAVTIVDSTAVSITDSTFTGNQTLESGGGAISLYWTKTTPQPDAVIDKCSFEGNQAAVDGGAIYSGYYPITVKESNFIGNISVKRAGALKLDYDNNSVSKIERCIFMNNQVTGSENGGALQVFAQSVVVENSVFAYNSTPASGGAVGLHSGINQGSYYNPSMTAIFTHCTFFKNDAGEWAGAVANVDVAVKLYNSIFWENSAVNYFHSACPLTNDYANFESGTLVTRYSDIQSYSPCESFSVGGAPAESHIGSFSADPMFVDPNGKDNVPGNLNDNFNLAANSPCVDRADGGFAPTLDMNFNARVDLRKTNMGTGSPAYADLGPYEVLEDDSVIIVPTTFLLLRN